MVAEEVTQMVIDKYGALFVLEGISFADEVTKMRKPVEFIETDDPRLNNGD